jgi:hypothetical protein
MPYKSSSEYMSWEECRQRCPKGAIKQTNGHHWIDQRLCDRCSRFLEYQCGGIFLHNSPAYLQDFNGYWEEWFTNYNYLLHQLRLKGSEKR